MIFLFPTAAPKPRAGQRLRAPPVADTASRGWRSGRNGASESEHRPFRAPQAGEPARAAGGGYSEQALAQRSKKSRKSGSPKIFSGTARGPIRALLPLPPKSLENIEFSRLFAFCCYTVFRGCTTYGGMSAYFQSLLYAIRQYHAQFNDYLNLKQ